MNNVLSYFPGMRTTIFLETPNSDGYRVDGYTPPMIERIFLPNFNEADGYFPQPMTKLDTGLFYFQYVLPIGAAAIGSYLIDVTYLSPATNNLTTEIFQLVVTAPFGVYSATTV